MSYVSAGYLHQAHRTLAQIRNPSVTSWNQIIRGFAGTGKNALKVFDEMPERNIVSWNTMLAGYVKCGDVDGARRLFDEMPERNIVSWPMLVSGYAHNGGCKEALCLIPEMLQPCMELDQVTLVAALSACVEIGDLKTGRWIGSYVDRKWHVKNKERTVCLNNALLSMYVGCGVIDDAYELFKRMPIKNTVSWTTMISGFAEHDRGKDALSVFHWMENNTQDDSSKPDAITMLVVLNACHNHYGLVEQGRHIFKNMKQVWGIEPKIEHYGCMIDLLSNAGLLDEACKLIQNMPMEPHDARPEIVFLDLETTFPTQPGQAIAILEFGAIVVCARKLVELEIYETLVKPDDLSLLSTLSVRANGITKDALLSAPSFSDIAEKVYNILHGRIWVGHNINRFDCARLREAFAKINRPPPEPKGTIDSLTLLRKRFGKRAGDMKMASLADYFGLGKQSHRSLDDVQMNLEVLKNCATVLFLESILPDITRNRNNAKSSVDGTGLSTSPPSSRRDIDHHNSPSTHPVFSLLASGAGEPVQNGVEPGHAQPDPRDPGPLVDEIENEPLEANDAMEEESFAPTASSTITDSTEFLDIDHVFIPSVTVTAVPCFRGPQNIQILHRDTPLQICCDALKVRFGLSTKFADHAGRARLSFVVDASSNLCGVLDACDDISKRFLESGSNSEWRPVVSRKSGFYNSPTIRLQLPTVAEGDGVKWITEIYQKESASSSSSIQRVVFSRYDVAELEQLIRPGSFVDAFFSLDPYDYQQNAGIRLVAKKLIVYSN